MSEEHFSEDLAVTRTHFVVDEYVHGGVGAFKDVAERENHKEHIVILPIDGQVRLSGHPNKHDAYWGEADDEEGGNHHHHFGDLLVSASHLVCLSSAGGLPPPLRLAPQFGDQHQGTADDGQEGGEWDDDVVKGEGHFLN